MTDSNLPVAPAQPSPVARPGSGDERGVPPGGGTAGGGAGGPLRRSWPVAPGVVLAVGALVLGLVAVLGLASLVGESLRNGVLIETDVSPAGSELVFSDAPEEAARFFARRDTVTVAVPWAMTVADFLALYHLENNPSARDALRDQLGAVGPGDPLREGDRVTFGVNLTRPAP